MLMKVVKEAGDNSKPDTVEMATQLNIGDKIIMQYDRFSRENKHSSNKGIAEFTVTDIACNMVVFPNSVWVRLDTNDSNFIKRCGGHGFDAPEQKVLERMV